MKGTKNLFNIIRTNIYRSKNNQQRFPFYGIEIYLGKYGSGKTLNCINRTLDINEAYPKSHIVSNITITHEVTNYNYVRNEDEFISTLIDVINKDKENNGIVVLIDEVGTFCQFLDEPKDTKYKIFFTILSQVRKLGIYFLFTQQVWNKVKKALRDYTLQNGQIIECRKMIQGFTMLYYYDMNNTDETSKITLKGTIKRRDYFIHTIELYESYKTYEVVNAINNLIDKKES